MKPALVFMLTFLLGCTSVAAADLQITKDIEYGVADGVSLQLDTYLLPGRPHPAVIHVHGGGFVSGDKEGTPNATWFDPLVGAGFSVISINYRLAPKHPFPAGPDDVQTAIRWVKENAKTLRIDPKRLVLTGESAGGFFVSYAGANYRPGNRVAAVIPFFGEHDFELRVTENPCAMDGYTKPLPEGGCISGGMAAFLGFSQIKTDQHRQILSDATCVNHVHKNMPPFLMIHGTRDYGVPIEQAHSMVKAMQDVGADVTLIPIVGGGHGGWNQPEQQHYKAEMVAWLKSRLKLGQ